MGNLEKRVRFVGKVKSLTQLVDWYLENNQHLKDMLAHFRKLPLRRAIHDAAASVRPDGKMYRHQWRNGHPACDQAAELLLEHEAEIRSCKSFDALLQLIKSVTSDVERFAALRIGANKEINKLPIRIYLHCGAEDGVRELGLSGKYLEKADLPRELHPMKPYEIENFLW